MKHSIIIQLKRLEPFKKSYRKGNNMVFYKPGNAVSRFQEAFLELRQDMEERARIIELVLNDYLLDNPEALLFKKMKAYYGGNKYGEITDFRVYIDEKTIDPLYESGGTGFEFRLFIDFKNKKAIKDHHSAIKKEIPVDFFSDFYTVENTIEKLIEERDAAYNLKDISTPEDTWAEFEKDINTLADTWAEFEKYLNEKGEDTLEFEKLMVFFFKEGRFLTFKQ